MSQTSPTSTGHVFVVNARIENLGWDAAIIPTDGAFTVTDFWQPLVGDNAAEHRPNSWPHDSAQSPRAPDLFFLNVASGPDQWHEPLLRLFAEIARSVRTKEQSGRVRIRVVMPTLGVGHGGSGQRRGQVIERVLDVVDAAAEEHGLDIVIVALESSDFAAFQAVRRHRRTALSESLETLAQELAGRARAGDLALFLGAGVSIPAGLPSWDDLLAKIADGKTENLLGLTDPLDQAELLRRELGDQLGQRVASILRKAGARHSLSHAQLASLGCREVVTTNFDTLYESACGGIGRDVLVLPWAQPEGARPWLLKLHGDIDHPDQIVLSRSDFNRFDANSGPAGALVQGLMLTRHLLFVGVSMTDANVLRLAHGVMDFRKRHGLDKPLGTVLTLTPEPGKQALWHGELSYASAGQDGDDPPTAGRELEILLDHVSMLAVSDMSYLLDQRYTSLLTSEEGDVVDLSSALMNALADLPSGRREQWWRLVAELGRHGAD